MGKYQVKGKVKVWKEGLTKSGLPYKRYTISEGIKNKDTGKYEYTNYLSMAFGDVAKKIIDGTITMNEGIIKGSKYTDKTSGKEIEVHTYFCNNVINDTFEKGKPIKETHEQEEAEELPFD